MAKTKKKTPALRDKEKWYANGLHFECTGCGHCCRWGEGYVWINERHIHEMADHLGLDVLQFARRYVRRVGSAYSLRELADYRCVLLDDDERCRVYPVRPTQCRTYPFWPENIRTPAAWHALEPDCPGLNNGRLYTPAEIEALARRTEEGD
ncbi:MAG: YkgJ family cysteine cluster protein [Verrucomicrobia bacterium]|nr:YkgJ family cysteine cluster protein [Verrucomicrobiota bacterium]